MFDVISSMASVESLGNLIMGLYAMAHEEEFRQEIRDTVDKAVKILYFDISMNGDVGFSAKYHTDDIEAYYGLFNDDRRILNESILVFMQQVLFELVGRDTKGMGSYEEVMK